jgi:curved DNA-binding protein CbpA
MLPDYYARLEVAPDATGEQIKAAYRRLVRLHHPDLNKQGKDTHIKKLNEAYAVLSSPARRVAYDNLRAEEQRAAVIADAIRQRQEAAKRKKAEEPKMTWMQGAVGFVRELRKALREE